MTVSSRCSADSPSSSSSSPQSSLSGRDSDLELCSVCGGSLCLMFSEKAADCLFPVKSTVVLSPPLPSRISQLSSSVRRPAVKGGGSGLVPPCLMSGF